MNATTLRPKVRNHAIRRDGRQGHRETWLAESADGEFAAERLEFRGTPWAIYWRPTPADPSVMLPMMYGSLARCDSAIHRGEPGWYVAVGILRLLGVDRWV